MADNAYGTKINKILIVEDDLAIRQMYEFKLSLAGYDVKYAGNGVDGLKIAESFGPSLILLDLKMPIMDGATMLETLRATEWGKNMRIIVLTNISRSEAPARLQFLGVDRYIVKAHHTPQHVADTVKDLVG